MAWIADQFNSWVGSNKSYLANASGGTILVAICENSMKIKSVSTSNIEFENNTNASKFNILDRQVYKYPRKNANDYLTAISHNGKTICENFRIGANKSYVITKDQILRHKPDDRNFFKDENDNEH
jgi:hypothetical protein